MSSAFPNSKLIVPLFLRFECENAEANLSPRPLRSIPNYYSLNHEQALEKIAGLITSGVEQVLLYPVFSSTAAAATQSSDYQFLLHFVTTAKRRFPSLFMILDLCLCHFNAHTECGLERDGTVDNDLTLEALCQLAVPFAQSGASALLISGMMDNAAATIRKHLDAHQLYDTILMVQSAKFDSAFYGPFQRLKDGPTRAHYKSSYQVDPANRRQALREIALDCFEGADIIVLKPTIQSLDLLPELAAAIPLPIFAYTTGGEFALLEATKAVQKRERLHQIECYLGSLSRAGVNAVITYLVEEYLDCKKTF